MIKCIIPFSGGKDSQACLKLAIKEFGADSVQGLFCDTQFEHPMTYKHIDYISELYGVKINKISAGSVEIQVRKNKRFPSGCARFCTEQLKIWPSKRFYNDFAMGNGGFEVWYGMRSEESKEREKRYKNTVDSDLYSPHEILKAYPKKLDELGVKFRLPVIDWKTSEIFDFLNGEENPLYSKGFSRVGCFPCLAAGDKHKELAFKFDETGRKHFELARELESVTNHSVFTSKGGQFRNDGSQEDLFEGCAICSI